MYFEKRIILRLRQVEVKAIKKILKKDKCEKYDNFSHFCRCAIIQQIKKEVK